MTFTILKQGIPVTVFCKVEGECTRCGCTFVSKDATIFELKELGIIPEHHTVDKILDTIYAMPCPTEGCINPIFGKQNIAYIHVRKPEE